MRVTYERLVVENFGPFHDRQVLTFAPVAGGAPVTMVDGKNGFGKTSLLEAVHWLLYGEADARRRALRVNRRAISEGDVRMRVELTFHRGGESHQILRVLSAPKNAPSQRYAEELSYLIGGVPQANPESKIRELLPESASQFFLFDGAKIARYADLENSEEVREAIELVLGLPAYENAAVHLKRLRERYEARARKEQARDEAAAGRVRVAEERAVEVERLRTDLAARQEELARHRREREALLAELARFDALKERLARIRHTESELARHKDRLASRRSELAREVRRYAQWHLLPLLEDRLLRLKEREAALKEASDATLARRFVMGFLDRAEHEHAATIGPAIAQLRELAEREHPAAHTRVDEQQLAETRVAIGRLEQKMRVLRHLEAPAEVRKEMKALRARVAQYETELRTIRRSIGDADEEQARVVFQRFDRTGHAIGEVQGHVAALESQLAAAEASYQEAQRELEAMRGSGSAGQLHARAERCRRLVAAFETILEKARNQKRRSIEEHATAFFRRVTRKKDVYDRFRINNDYTLALLDKAGIEQRRDLISSGEKQLVALSFIVGLMQSTQRVAPLIIDTPFGHLDRAHRAHVAAELPRVGQQVTFLVTDADVLPEYESALAAVTGKRYVIRYDQETQSSGLVEVS